MGGARAVMPALLDAVGPQGLIGMPGFSSDASFPVGVKRPALDESRLRTIERAVLGFDPARSPTVGMGAIAEIFRTWPGTLRGTHPTSSICLNGSDAARYLTPHSLAWSCGPNSPLGRLRDRPAMKILLLGVGWNRCSALHTAETLAESKRTKIRYFKTGPGDAPWMETPDVADDLNRLFPDVGEAIEETGVVGSGSVGQASSRLVDFPLLVDFATRLISEQNESQS